MRRGKHRGPKNGSSKDVQATKIHPRENGFFAKMPVGLVREILQKVPDRKTLKTMRGVNRFFEATIPELLSGDYFSRLKLVFARPLKDKNNNGLGSSNEKISLHLEQNGRVEFLSCSSLGFEGVTNFVTAGGLAHEFNAARKTVPASENGVSIYALAVKKNSIVLHGEKLNEDKGGDIFQFAIKPGDFFIIGLCHITLNSGIRLVMNSGLAHPPFFDLQTQTDIGRGKNILVQDFRVQVARLKNLVCDCNHQKDIEESERVFEFIQMEEKPDTRRELEDDEPLLIVVRRGSGWGQ